jgi:hypothetical protein
MLEVMRPPRLPSGMSQADPGCAKTKSDLVVMPSGGRIFAFFCSDPKQTPDQRIAWSVGLRSPQTSSSASSRTCTRSAVAPATVVGMISASRSAASRSVSWASSARARKSAMPARLSQSPLTLIRWRNWQIGASGCLTALRRCSSNSVSSLRHSFTAALCLDGCEYRIGAVRASYGRGEASCSACGSDGCECGSTCQ